MSNPTIAVNLVVLNGEIYIRQCLEALRNQSYPHERIEINILDNGSHDKTISIIEEYCSILKDFVDIRFTKSTHNFGMWGGQEELLKQTKSGYIVVLSVDVVLEKDFLTNAVQLMEQNASLGAIQGKIYQYDAGHVSVGPGLPRDIIDTCGFNIFRSRRIVNIGHGERDQGQFDEAKEIFGVEGAVPVIRAEALRSIRVMGEIADHDLFWYAEDLDIAWRLRLAGWSQRYEPTVVAWHDRQTTKKVRHSFGDFLAIRRAIPLRKRRLEWRNIRCTIIKNDYIINFLKDLPYWLPREIAMAGYLLVFETKVLSEVTTLIGLLPRMFKKRRLILSHAKTSPAEIHSYFS